MVSKYRGNLGFYLEILENQTGLSLSVHNDGDNHFIMNNSKGEVYGHSGSISQLYSMVFMTTEVISAARKLKEEQTKEGAAS